MAKRNHEITLGASSGRRWKLLSASALVAFFLMLLVPLTAHAQTNGSIHIFAFNSSDAILIESNGLYGMVDSGEDNDYPSGEDERYPLRSGITIGQGTEEEVIDYLKQQGVTSENFVFYIGTHAHSDHIGSADEIIREFKPEYVYTPLYDDLYITNSQRLWDNQYVYDRMLEAAEEVGAVIVQVLTEQQRYIEFGNLVLEICNYRDIGPDFRVNDANDYSWGVKVSDGVSSAFLAGDIDNLLGSEDDLAQYLGKVDALKLAHHGYSGSNTAGYVSTLSPKIAVLTGVKSSLPDETSDALFDSKAQLISIDEAKSQGKQVVVLTFGDNGISSNISVDTEAIQYRERHSSPYFAAYRDFEPVTLNGWVQHEGSWYYFENSNIALEGAWKQISGARYYLLPNARMSIGWANVGGTWYYFDGSGIMQTGWVHTGDSWYYLEPSGAMATGWKYLNGAWYYLESSGAMATGWVCVNGSWYFLSKSGAMLTGWILDGDTWYYANSSGAMLAGWINLGGSWYYLDGSGAMRVGWANVGGSWYYMGSSGAMKTGWILDSGTWYYTNASGRMLTGWQWLGGSWYYLDGSGAMAVGWKNVSGDWYYLNGSGAMATGWQWDGSAWYYLNRSGVMQTGWLRMGSDWYYLKPSGAMATGWANAGGTWYLMNGSGIMLTGWQRVGDTWYLLSQSGAMQTGWQLVDGSWYYLDASGAMQTGWLQLGDTRYFLNSSGVMQTGPKMIDGELYLFDESGALTASSVR